MSLGLFNCRLVQPAGDQLFFLSAVLPHRCPFGQALFSLLVTHSARPDQREGGRMLLAFPSQKEFVLVFRGSGTQSDPEGFTPIDSPSEFPRRSPILPIDSAIEPDIHTTGQLHVHGTPRNLNCDAWR